MNIFGKTPGEYWAVSKMFLLVTFLLMLLIAILRRYDINGSVQSILSVLGLAVLIWAGWSVSKDHGFDLKQVLFTGFILSFGTHWALLMFHRLEEIPFLFLVNSVIYAAAACFGGLLQRKVTK